MKCGAKCFIVTLEKDGVTKHDRVTARTTAAARKIIRRTYGNAIEIISVRAET